MLPGGDRSRVGRLAAGHPPAVARAVDVISNFLSLMRERTAGARGHRSLLGGHRTTLRALEGDIGPGSGRSMVTSDPAPGRSMVTADPAPCARR
jgi:hypothetical protein